MATTEKDTTGGGLESTRFLDVAEAVFADRDRRGIKTYQERIRFKHHIATAPFAEKSIERITRAEVQNWLGSLRDKVALKRGTNTLALSTIERAGRVCAAIFSAAMPEGLGLIEISPFHGWNIGPFVREGARAKEDEWTYLTKAEQDQIASCTEMLAEDRLVILFAIGTGLSAAEQFNLRTEDVVLDTPEPHVIVRTGSPMAKRGPRTVPLLGPSAEAARQWRELLPTAIATNPAGLFFPRKDGLVRGNGKPFAGDAGFRKRLLLAGIERPIAWRDLRHTCGASMALGLWGPRYPVTDIQLVLGFSHIRQAERYAKLVESRLGPVPSADPPRVMTTGNGTFSSHDAGELVASRVVTAQLHAGHVQIDSSPPAQQQPETSRSPPRYWMAPRLALRPERVREFAEDLLFPLATFEQATAALSAGKHVLLVGAPGTGKTAFAHALVAAATAHEYASGGHVVTASADWTTFDTIGGYSMDRAGALRFRPGALLQALDEHKWLVIDELNR